MKDVHRLIAHNICNMPLENRWGELLFHAEFNSSRPTGFNVVEICPKTNCFLDRVKLSGEINLPSILYWMRIHCKPKQKTIQVTIPI